MGNIISLKFAGGPTNQGRTGNMQGDWYPDRSLAVVTDVGVPVEEDLSNIIINTRRELVNLEYDCEEAWIN